MRLSFDVSGATPAELQTRAQRICDDFDAKAMWRLSIDCDALAYRNDGTVLVWVGHAAAQADEWIDP